MASLRYIGKDGKEATVDGIKAFLQAVEGGQLGPQTMVFDEQSQRWIPASDSAEYRSLTTGRAVLSAQDEARQFKRHRLIGWGLLAAGVASLFLTEAVEPKATRGAFLAGEYLVWALFGTLVIFATTARLPTAQKAGAWLVVCSGFFLWCAYSAVDVVVDAKQAERSRAEAREAAQRLAQVARETAGSLRDQAKGRPGADTKLSEIPPAAHSPAATEYASLKDAVELVQRHFYLFGVAQRQHTSAVEKMGFDTVLTAQTLTSKSGIERARGILRDFTQASTAYERRVWATFDSMLRDAEALPMRPKEKAAFMAGVNKSRGNSVATLKEWFEVQRSVATEVEAVLNFVAPLVGKTHVRGGQIIFPDAEKAEQYNAHIARVNELAAREQQIMERQAAVIDKSASNLEQVVR